MGTKKNFVIDTNVILHDYNCLKNFQENDFLDFNVDICSLIHQSSVYSWNDGSKDKQFCEQ